MATKSNLGKIIEEEFFNQALKNAEEDNKSELERKIKSISGKVSSLEREVDSLFDNIYNKIKEISRDLGINLADYQISSIVREIIDNIKKSF